MVSLTAIVGGTRGGDTPAAQLRIWEDILSGQGSVKHFLLVLMYKNVSVRRMGVARCSSFVANGK